MRACREQLGVLVPVGLIDRFRFLRDEGLYVQARLAFNAGLLLLFIWGAQSRLGSQTLALVLVTITTLGTVYVLVQAHRGHFATVAMHVLLSDLVVLALLTDLFHGREDAFYPAVILLAVTYSLVVERRHAWIAAGGITIAYTVGHLVPHDFLVLQDVEILGRALAIMAVSMLVASTVEHTRQREAETVSAVAEAARLNHEMRQRINELQAVAEITEVIHSSLDFDRVGPVVLEILAKTLNVDTCCLFVIDKDRSDTVFSATYGVDSGLYTAGGDFESISDHFACTSIFDHNEIMVLFCSTAAQIESIGQQDRLVLGAVASELVVAVENSRLYKLTKTLAVTDELTGLSNYRYLHQKLDEEIERARRYDKRLSLLMIDIDDFKRFNDANGHLAGDAALTELGSVMRAAVREVDIAARYGGEEFSVLLPETDASGAFVTAEKIREAVSEHAFADSDGERVCHLTVSVGLATLPTHASDKESLLREADDAVYNAKHGGKNRVRAAWRQIPGQDGNGDGTEPAVVDEWMTGE